jgi:hypothetical protein
LGELTTLDIDVGDGPTDTPIVALQPSGYDPELWEPQEWAGRPIHWGDPLLLTVGADPIDGYDTDPNRNWLVIDDAPQGGYLKDVQPLNALVLAAAFNRDAATGVFHELAAVEHTLTELNQRFPKDWYPWEAVDEAKRRILAASRLLGSAPQSADLKKRDDAPPPGKLFAPAPDEIPDWHDIPTIWVETDPVWTACRSDDGRVRIAVTKPQLSAISIAEL